MALSNENQEPTNLILGQAMFRRVLKYPLACTSDYSQSHNNFSYHMTSSVSGQVKMNQIQRCDWLPERAKWSYLARSGFFAWSRKIKDLFLMVNPI